MRGRMRGRISMDEEGGLMREGGRIRHLFFYNLYTH